MIQTITFDSGSGGRIALDVERLIVQSGGQIDASARSGTGRAGDVVLTATDSVSISGQDENGFFSGVFANSDDPSLGDGGNIVITAPLV